jgi:zinc transporter, ZIP family
VLKATLYGLGTALPLVLGAAVGLRWQLPKRVLAALMAFGAGTMIAAVSSELFQPAFDELGGAWAGLALLVGAAIYVVADRLIEHRLGPASLGWALMLGTILDGVPENTALGVSLTESGGVVLLIAVAVGNLPESISGAAQMRRQHGVRLGRVMWMWVATGVVLVLVTMFGYAASDSVSSEAIAAIQAVAGGATIAVLADSLMPEAYKEGGWWVGLATALGFVVAFALGA